MYAHYLDLLSKQLMLTSKTYLKPIYGSSYEVSNHNVIEQMHWPVDNPQPSAPVNVLLQAEQVRQNVR